MLEFYVGGYAEPGQKGILKCAFDGEKINITDANDELCNPSWVLAHPSKPLLYAVEERSPEGGLAVLSEADGHLKVVARVSTKGADPCHIAITPDERDLLVSNYSGGSLAVIALDEDGTPAGLTDFIQHRMDAVTGNPVRQEAPHIHFSLCDGKHVYVNDLGLNRVFIYGWDGEAGKLVDIGQAIDFPEGSGPRHLAFSQDGDCLYVLCELNATVHVFRREPDDGWRRAQVVSTVPGDFTDYERYTWSCGAAIRFMDARTLCASTRGHDSVAVFPVGPEGLLGDPVIIPSGGRTPRDFMAVKDHIFIANQDSDRVCVVKRSDAAFVELEPSIPAIHPTSICPFVLVP